MLEIASFIIVDEHQIDKVPARELVIYVFESRREVKTLHEETDRDHFSYEES